MTKSAVHVRISAGDPLPWFTQSCTSNEKFQIQTVGGRYVVLGFLGNSSDANSGVMLKAVQRCRPLFDDEKLAFFGITITPEDKMRVREQLPGIRWFFDFDSSVSRACGATAIEGQGPYRQFWIVLNPDLRVRAVVDAQGADAGADELHALLAGLPPLDQHKGSLVQAPVLVLPNVFDAAMCKRLIGLYESEGGRESGFMREINGKTVEVRDLSHKSRSDHVIEDAGLQSELQAIFKRRVVPEILKAHQFKVTRMERYLVGCYDAENGGHFRAHRDNTTRGTAHRRFAVSVNLNDDFDGGEVSFPEFSPKGFKAPPGGAVVFSCSLLHAVSPILKGKRFAFLPFLYDDAAAKIREENAKFIEGSASNYKVAG
jgi:predicted 2-oxoglutarate/Fe(II)-dependent dioxygenase YbiX